MDLRKSIDYAKKKLTVMFHQDCDGFGAAFAVWCKFGDKATYIPVNYSQPVPEIPAGTDMLYIVDFSYPRAVCEELAGKYDLMVFDHHKTAEKELAGLPYAVFDQNLSGCGLTWQALHDEPMPTLLEYVQDRDLWQFKLPHSEIINLYIATLPWDFKAWYAESKERGFYTDAKMLGRAIKAFRDSQISDCLKNVRMMRIDGHEVPVVNAVDNHDEVGAALCKAYPDSRFSVTYRDESALRRWSLRSVGEFDVSQMAKIFGGGGHKNSAGFTTEINWMQYDSDEFIKTFAEEAAK